VGGPGSKILDRAISVTHGRRKGEPCPSWILKLLAKRLFFQFRGVKTTFPPPWQKYWENPPVAPPGRNPSDARAVMGCRSL